METSQNIKETPCCGKCANFVRNRHYCSTRGTKHSASDTGIAACRDDFTPGEPIYKKNRHGN
ncbi:MAG: hypothetical protein II038_06340 [Lachnospiraceae bacterium]|nr:hypothetical protein [Lachnospiraceae bacterium]